MTLDPQVARLIAATEQSGLRPYEEQTPAQARETYMEVVRMRRGAGYVPQPVGSVSDRVVDGIGVRIYRPESTAVVPEFPPLPRGNSRTPDRVLPRRRVGDRQHRDP